MFILSFKSFIESFWPNKQACHYAQGEKELKIALTNIGSSKNSI